MLGNRDKPAAERSRFERFVRKLWWLHSMWALVFGVGVMMYARKGLAHADKLLLILAASWFLVFFALRFIVGPDNQRPDDKLIKKGIRLGTNYVIKNLYQQMLFFLVPLYASSATWSLQSANWWLVPVLLVAAVLSTMDLVMDNFIMQKKVIASVMYAVCMFGVLNLMLPIALSMSHFEALVAAASAAVPCVALLTFRFRQVLTFRGLALTIGGTALLAIGAHYAAPYIPPAPLAMAEGGVSHGTPGSYEEVPGHKTAIPVSQLDGLRCVTRLTKPGGLHDAIVHEWQHGDRTWRVEPDRIEGPHVRGFLFRSYGPDLSKMRDPLGDWACRVETGDGQLIGLLRFRIEQ